MSERSTCPKCGAKLANDTPGTPCARCLMGAAMSPKPRDGAGREFPVDFAGFEHAVLSLKLLDARDFQRCDTVAPGNVLGVARALVRAGKLTPYQAGAILQGKARGLVIGNYFVLGKLGAGGMGVVFKARHRRLGRVVALKILPPSFGRDRERVLRFRREVDVAAKLSHPHIVSVLDADEDRGVHFLTMEYIEGQDLHQLVVDGGALPVNQAVDCVIQAARGLESAHAAGIVHRDVKPGNLMLDRAGVVRVLDLGLARFIEGSALSGEGEDDALTRTGTTMGTVDFMAPEQANDSKKADHRADVYSLGCSLHFLLTRRPPFDGESILKRIIAHQEEPIPSLRASRAEVPRPLDAAYQKMMAKRPADRPRSMTEVIVLLEDCRASPEEAVEARSGLMRFATTVFPQVAPIRHASGDASSLFTPDDSDDFEVEIDLEIGDFVADDRPEKRVEGLTPPPLPPTIRESIPKRPRASRHAWVAGALGLGLGLGASGLLGFALLRAPHRADETAVPETTTPSVPITTSTSTTKSRGSYVGTELFKGHTQRVKAVALAKNGRLAISAGHDSTARIWEVSTGLEILPVLKHPLPRIVMDVAITPDGSLAITGTHGDLHSENKKMNPNGAVRIWETATAKAHLFAHAHQGDVRAVAISPDGRRALSGGSQGDLVLWDLETIAKVRTVGHQDGLIHEHGIAFFPDNRHAVTVGDDPFIHVWDVETGEESSTLNGQEGHKGCVTISPDGRRVATGGKDKPGEPGSAYLWDVPSKTLIRRFETRRQGGSVRVAFATDDQLAGTSLETGEVVLWDVDSGAILRESETTAVNPSNIIPLPDGRLLTADGDGVVRLWTPRGP